MLLSALIIIIIIFFNYYYFPRSMLSNQQGAAESHLLLFSCCSIFSVVFIPVCDSWLILSPNVIFFLAASGELRGLRAPLANLVKNAAKHLLKMKGPTAKRWCVTF